MLTKAPRNKQVFQFENQRILKMGLGRVGENKTVEWK